MRRISTGIQGRSILGSFVAETNRFTTREVNQDLVLEPDGTGIVRSASDFKIDGTNGSLILETDNGNEVKLQTAAGASYTLTMPTSAPADGQVLISNASGSLTFDDINLPVSNQTADTAAYYPLMNTATSGDITGVSVSSSKLSFQPSSGKLTVDNIIVNDDVTISGTMTAASIVETSSIALKQNVEPIQDALAAVTQLKGVTYDRRDTQEHEAGLIAEWVDQVLPDLVTSDADGGVIGIKYTKLTAYLIEAVKTLKIEIDELRNK